jgi:xanthine/CO dehydrogenase XdhC/CoxF family maturation factor
MVLSNAGAEDPHPLDAAGCAGADGHRPWRTPIRCSTTSTSRSIATLASSKAAGPVAAATAARQGALRRAGDDIALISYGAYVHVASRVAEKLAADGIEASVLDLRTLAPLDKDTMLAVARHCSRC